MRMHKTFKDYTYIIFVIFLFALPKSGLTIGPIPLYFGFPLLVLVIVFNISELRYMVSKKHFIFLFFLFWYFLRVIIYVVFKENGIGQLVPNLLGYFIGIIFFLINFRYLLKNEKYINSIFKVIYYCGIVIVAFGIFQLMIGIENSIIPGVTFNYTQYKQGIDYTSKYNVVNGVLKLPSTYQNGNLYGLFLISYFPIYRFYSQQCKKNMLIKKMFELLIIFSIFRTLSRTAIFGFVFYIVLSGIIKLSNRDSFKLNKRFFIQGYKLLSLTFILFIFFSYNNNLSLGESVIFQRMTSQNYEDSLDGRFNTERTSFNSPSELLIGDLLYHNESYYVTTLHVLGGIMGVIYILAFIYYSLYIIKILVKQRQNNNLFYYVCMGFITMEVAGILDLSWGSFPIETQFWFYFSYIYMIIKTKYKVDN